MAGKPQKPYDQLQNTRGNRRRPPVRLRPVPYRAAEGTEEGRSPRDRAIDVAIGAIARSFGRGVIARATPTAPPARPKRKYRPKGERPVSEAKAKVAAERPRDARGHFLPSPDSRRARIRAANAALPAALLAVVGDGEQLLAALAVVDAPDDAA